MEVKILKKTQLENVAQHRENLRISPKLKWLFFEITSKCNLLCRHCGSSCITEGRNLSVNDISSTLNTVRDENPMICLTGGEPMLHPDFFRIAECVKDMGFFWGMTTNATLIDHKAAEKLKQAGMATVSVSLDGMESAHDSLRQRKGSWHKALEGIQALQDAGLNPQVTTVFHQGNLDDMEPLFNLLCDHGITSWRPINVEPIGRACETHNLLLTPQQFSGLLSFIREKRYDRNCPMEVTFGCSHYLGVENERMVRDHYFLCGAGILVASVRSNGDICACLDIDNRPELVQGNIHSDNFMDVWKNRFQVFRRDRTSDCGKCMECSERFICGGDSAHTWDYEHDRPLLCFMDFKCDPG
jgi:radical SAM protein with 4Fe4S-binding SPASM domain